MRILLIVFAIFVQSSYLTKIQGNHLQYGDNIQKSAQFAQTNQYTDKESHLTYLVQVNTLSSSTVKSQTKIQTNELLTANIKSMDDETTDDSDSETETSDDSEDSDDDDSTVVVLEDLDLSLDDYDMTEDQTISCIVWYVANNDDDNEYLTANEWHQALDDLGYNVYQADLFLNMVDGINGVQYKDGNLTIHEVINMCTIYYQLPYYKQIFFLFFAADSDVDNYLSSDEFDKIIDAYGDMFDLDFDTADVDGNDFIDIDELLVVLSVDEDYISSVIENTYSQTDSED